ncbi:hypothetical protein F66182_8448 [Fusarium sp. NRRL 66182]|nr:hypothetical protein F66182_8448 [Fusarium sp. NRRL 66182]
MPSVKYMTPPGFLEELSKGNHYSQAVDLGNGFFKASGQGGENDRLEFPSDLKEEVENAVHNVDYVLQAAGLRGWEDVYYIRSYHTDIDALLPLLAQALKKRIPDHRPGHTALGVAKLALPDMRLEIEVDAKKQVI